MIIRYHWMLYRMHCHHEFHRNNEIHHCDASKCTIVMHSNAPLWCIQMRHCDAFKCIIAMHFYASMWCVKSHHFDAFKCIIVMHWKKSLWSQWFSNVITMIFEIVNHNDDQWTKISKRIEIFVHWSLSSLWPNPNSNTHCNTHCNTHECVLSVAIIVLIVP